MSEKSLVGVAGKQYGLILKPQNKPQEKAKLKVPSAFAQDDDEPETAEQLMKRDAEKKQRMKKTQTLHEQALAEDPTIFDFDGVYDSMKQNELQEAFQLKLSREGETKKPRYYDAILDKAKERKREQDIIYNRKLIKESEQEGSLYGEKDKFMTSAYKKKLEEDKLWLEEEKKREMDEVKNDVTKRGNLLGFYSNLMDSVAKDKQAQISSAYSKPQSDATTTTTSKKDIKEDRKDKEDDRKHRDHRDSRDSRDNRDRDRDRDHRDNRDREYRQTDKDREYRDRGRDNRREESSTNKKRGTETTESKTTTGSTSGGPTRFVGGTRIVTEEELAEEYRKKEAEEAEAKKKAEEEEQMKKLARRNTEDAVADAKARYLQRKAQLKAMELEQLKQNT